jgi:hypothetical protein
MSFPRLSWLVGAAAILAACSGNIGGGQSTLPGALPSGGNSIQQIAQAAPTSTPVSASNVATVGENTSPQPLPNIAGWGGSIAFPLPSAAPSPAPNAKATAIPLAVPTGPISIGVTAAVVQPSDAPTLGTAAGKRHGKHAAGGPQPLLFISLLATTDVTLGHYPTIALDVPREIVTKHRSDLFALAFYDPTEKAKAFRLDVAERDLSSPAPGSLPSATPTASPTPLRSPTPPAFGPTNGQLTLTPPPLVDADSGLPPEYVAFKAAPAPLTLKANVPAVFALYAIAPSPSPSPSTSAAGHGAAASPTPTAAGSAAPSPSPVGTATPTPHPV